VRKQPAAQRQSMNHGSELQQMEYVCIATSSIMFLIPRLPERFVHEDAVDIILQLSLVARCFGQCRILLARMPRATGESVSVAAG